MHPPRGGDTVSPLAMWAVQTGAGPRRGVACGDVASGRLRAGLVPELAAEFRVLGSVDVLDDAGVRVVIGGAQEWALLALLWSTRETYAAMQLS